MKNLSKYGVLFLLSLVPYAAVVLMTLIVAVTGFGYNIHGNQAYGFVAVSNWLSDIGSFWFYFPNIKYIIIFVCVIYQIVYLLGLRGLSGRFGISAASGKPCNEDIKESVQNETTVSGISRKKAWKPRKVFLWLSFAPYLLLLLFAVGHALFGTNEWQFFGRGSIIYGRRAFAQTFILGAAGLTVIPVIPICLIFQIVYMITKRHAKRKKPANAVSSDNGTRHMTKACKIALITVFAVWGVICLQLLGLFSLSADNPYIDPDYIRRTADFSFVYTSNYSEQNLIPAGAIRYVHLDEMRLYWYKNGSFGYNRLLETDEMYMGREGEYDVLLSWGGEGKIKAAYAVGENSAEDQFFDSDATDYPAGNILGIYIELHDGRLLKRDATFTHS